MGEACGITWGGRPARVVRPGESMTQPPNGPFPQLLMPTWKATRWMYSYEGREASHRSHRSHRSATGHTGHTGQPLTQVSHRSHRSLKRAPPPPVDVLTSCTRLMVESPAEACCSLGHGVLLHEAVWRGMQASHCVVLEGLGRPGALVCYCMKRFREGVLAQCVIA